MKVTVGSFDVRKGRDPNPAQIIIANADTGRSIRIICTVYTFDTRQGQNERHFPSMDGELLAEALRDVLG